MSQRKPVRKLMVSFLALCLGLSFSITSTEAATGDISTVAGGGINDGAPASNAGTLWPWSVFVDPSGNIYISDWGGSRIQKIDAATGIMNVIVGNGLSGRFLGDSGAGLPADQLTISAPNYNAADSQGNVYFRFQGSIHKADASGNVTFVTNGTIPMAVDDNDNFYFRDGNTVKKMDAVTGAKSFIVGTQPLNGPNGLTFDAAGNFYFLNQWQHQLFKMTPSGTVTAVAGDGFYANDDGDGRFAGDGGPAISASFGRPAATAVDAAGNIYVYDENNFRIRRIDAATGVITTVVGTGVAVPNLWNVGLDNYSAGDGGQGTDAQIGSQVSIAVDSAGDLYLADPFNLRVRKLDTTTGIITTVAGGGNSDIRLPLEVIGDGTGTLYVSSEGGNVVKVFPSGEYDFVAQSLNAPEDIALDAAGNLYIAETGGQYIRKVDAATGAITIVAGSAAQGYGGDGGPATDATMNNPLGLALDSSGNVYFADSNNGVVRKVDASTGVISTIAGGGTSSQDTLATAVNLSQPVDVFVDAADVLYISEGNGGHAAVRKLDASGNLVTVAGNLTSGFSGDGGPATDAELGNPLAIEVTAGGDIYIWDSTNQRIRKVDGASGIISTIAGNGQTGDSGDGGPATDASFNAGSRGGLYVDANGDVYLTDRGNHRVRKVDATTGNVSSVVGTVGEGGDASFASFGWPRHIAIDSGDNLYISEQNTAVWKVDAATWTISKIAGNGAGDFSGDGGPATDAGMNEQLNISVDDAGNVYIWDAGNFRVRKVDAATGTINTVAGGGFEGSGGDGGPATDAGMPPNWAGALVVDGPGNIYIADRASRKIRKVDVATGIITTLLGAKGSLLGTGTAVQQVMHSLTACNTFQWIPVETSTSQIRVPT